MPNLTKSKKHVTQLKLKRIERNQITTNQQTLRTAIERIKNVEK